MKTNMLNSMSRTFHKVGFKLKQHAPEILVVAGTVGVVASAVMACKATTKLDTILSESKTEVNKYNEYVEENGYSEQYTETDHKKDLTIVYAQTGVKLAKLYAPSVALGALSITSILASTNILKKRNVAIAAAYTAVDKGFKEYRSRVAERFGEVVEQELRYNIKPREIEHTVVDENGNEKIITKAEKVITAKEDYDDYARIFDEGSLNWVKDAELNLSFLKIVQAQATDKLQRQGYLYLNDVYKMLDIPTSKAGQVVGWIYDPTNPEHKGDNYVSFGLDDVKKLGVRNFVNGYEPRVYLSFNVDGVIWDKM